MVLSDSGSFRQREESDEKKKQMMDCASEKQFRRKCKTEEASRRVDVWSNSGASGILQKRE
jgi:hypothetical protein